MGDYLLIATGSKDHEYDHAVGAKVLYSKSVGIVYRKSATCGNHFLPLGEFQHPVFAQNITSLGKIGCIKIVFDKVEEPKKHWFLISEAILAFPDQLVVRENFGSSS